MHERGGVSGGISARKSTLKHEIQRRIGGILEHSKELRLLRGHVDYSAARGNSLEVCLQLNLEELRSKERGERGIVK